MDLLPARWHVALDHFRFHGKFPNLEHPTTLSEKIASRKLNDRDPRFPALVDKITAKEAMATRFGPDFIIPTLTTFQSEREIDFARLTYPCVIKANHGSNLNLFLMERPANEEAVRRKLGRLLRQNYFMVREEWAYSQVPKRLLVEPYIDGGEHGLVDYKLHTFSGRVFAIEVVTDRYTTLAGATFDPNWNEMPCQIGTPKTEYPIPRPHGLEEMIRYAQEIGSAFQYVRIDFYEIEGKVKFGEMTFYPGGGLDVFSPREFDELFGKQWA